MSVLISVVVPVYNEEKNISILYRKIVAAFAKMRVKSFEVIFVDDGSTDSSLGEMKRLSKRNSKVKTIVFTRNFGQTFAWDAGIRLSKGKYIVTIDADLQNDPKEIKLLFDKLLEGYDVVSGWRAKRQDSFSKRFFSLFANALRRLLIKEEIHDSGCSLKIYRRECFDGLQLFEGMRRFITAVMLMRGFKVAEVKVSHCRRKFGKTKYGHGRLVTGFLELMMIVFLVKYSSMPLRLFGTLGILSFVAGTLIGLHLTIENVFFGAAIGDRAMLLLAVLLAILGILLFALGILAEFLARTYFKVGKSRPYVVRETVE